MPTDTVCWERRWRKKVVLYSDLEVVLCQALTFDMRIDRWDGDFMAFFERERERGVFLCGNWEIKEIFNKKKSKKEFQGVTFPRGHKFQKKKFIKFLLLLQFLFFK